MDRRTFLHHASHTLAVPGVMSTLGFFSPRRLKTLLRLAEETDRVLVLIYLQGGNDGLNTVIPLDQLSALHSARPHVILPDTKILKLNGTQVALHPSLPNFRSLHEEGRLGIVQSVGYPDQNYSHFRSTDIWMSGSDADTLIGSGWSGRYLGDRFPGFPQSFPNDDMPDPLAIELGYGSSLLFQGPAATMGMVISDPNSFYQLVDDLPEEGPDTDAGDKLRFIQLTARQSQQYGQVVKMAASKIHSQPGYDNDNYLAQQLKIVARLIAGGLKTPLYMVRIGSFDTHSAQVDSGDHTKGMHSELLSLLDGAVMSFLNDLEAHQCGDRVVGMTFSEFGRRITSNGSGGTDHGAASPMFVFGNKVLGGVTGQNPHIPNYVTNENNLEWEFDFRQIYASILEQWFGATAMEAADVLFDEYEGVPLIGERVTGLPETPFARSLTVYPNPVTGRSNIAFTSSGSPMRIQVVDIEGRMVSDVFSGSLPSGKQVVILDATGLAAGRYFVLLRSPKGSQTAGIVKL